MPLGKMPWIVNAASFVPQPGTCGVIPGVHIYVIPELRRPQPEGTKSTVSDIYASTWKISAYFEKKKRHIFVKIITYY